jgi:molybdenum cofactor biosynthesis enzyme MoaA
MANKSIFCNVPWTNIHVYWDGSYGICCSERHKPYDEADKKKYNLSIMPIHEWYNSAPVREFRQQILSDSPLTACSSCYKEESVEYESRRIKENFKSVIFTKQAFERSYLQSPWINKFEDQYINIVPIDWHIDFGNECNLSCKMCNQNASSAIATILRQHKLTDVEPKVSWTKNNQAWANFLTAVNTIKINRIHVMGGEPVMMRKYHEFIDYLIEQQRFEISLSFVTNGTIINQTLIDKLKLFKNVDIEISIEAIDNSNDYIRQGSKIDQLRSNIEDIISQQDDKLQVVLRTVPQLLNISRYASLIRYAWDNKLIIEPIPLTRPEFLRIDILPWEYRQQYIADFKKLRDEIKGTIQFNAVMNGRSKGTLSLKLASECDAIIQMLQASTNTNAEKLRKELVDHCSFWDKEYNLKIKDYIPELLDMFKRWGYEL